VALPSGLLRATGVACVWRAGLVLVELKVVEERYRAVMEVMSGGAPVVEVAGRYVQDGERVVQRAFVARRVICPGRISRWVRKVPSPRNALLVFGE
jgi:hypothetical protein